MVTTGSVSTLMRVERKEENMGEFDFFSIPHFLYLTFARYYFDRKYKALEEEEEYEELPEDGEGEIPEEYYSSDIDPYPHHTDRLS